MSRDSSPVSAQETEQFEPQIGDMIRSLVRMLARQKWFILIPMAVVSGVVARMAMELPNTYVSESTVGVIQQQVSERYVTTDAVPIYDAVNALRQEILSRGSLLRIIEELDLYGDRSQALPEDLVARIQEDLNVEAIEARHEEITSLRISFTAEDPEVAQRVTQRLTDTFMSENVKQTESRVRSNNTFLDEQVRAAEAKLLAQEARLGSYKTRNIDQLPEQQTSNSLALADLRARARAIAPEMERAVRNLRSLEATVSDKLTRMQSDRADLLKRYTAQNPVVVKQDGEIAKYTALREIFSPNGPSAKARQILVGADDAQIALIRNQAEDLSNDIDSLRRQESELEGQIKEYQVRVTSAPLREQEQASILRDYNLLKADYEALKSKQSQSALNSTLEQKDGGQRFRLIEPASLPIRPAGPKRLRFALGGVAGGFILGLALAFLRGSVDTTFSSEKDVAVAFSVPLVLGIPEILTPGEQTARTWKKVFDWVGSTALILCVISTGVYVYIKG